jgi:hypothetical protein
MQYIAGFFMILAVLSGTAALWMKIQLQAAEAEVQVLVIELSAERANVAQLEDEMDLVAVQVGQFQEKIAKIEAERATARKQVEYTRNLFNDGRFARLVKENPSIITLRMGKASAKVLADLQSVSAQ